jgi:hypothetical protein
MVGRLHGAFVAVWGALSLGLLTAQDCNLNGVPDPLDLRPPFTLDAAYLVAAPSRTALSLGDVDGDGRTDLVVADSVAGSVSVFPGDGAGGLLAPSEWKAGGEALGLYLGDLDGDGDLDIATRNERSLSVLLQERAGRFSEPTSFPVGTESRTNALRGGDVDGDGDLDLVSVNGAVALHLNDGRAGFAPPLLFEEDTYPVELELPDLDGDGALELLVRRWRRTLSAVVVLWNEGAAQFSAAVPLPETSEVSAFTAVDVNADADVDVAVAVRSTPSSAASVLVFRNAGGRRFEESIAYPSRYTPYFLAPFDVDADDDLDLLFLHGRGFGFLFNDDGFNETRNFPRSRAPEALGFAHLDADEAMDAALVDQSTVRPSILLRDGDGFRASLLDPPAGWPYDVAAGDLDGDGRDDLVSANFGAADFTVLWNQGGGRFSSPTQFPGRTATTVITGDLNGDGLADVVLLDSGSTAVVFAREDRTFDPPVLLRQFRARTLLLADIEGDGDLDVLTGAQVHVNQGESTFLPSVRLMPDPDPTSIAAGDWDADGSVDLALTSSTALSLHLNRGELDFVEAWVFGPKVRPSLVRIADVDQDETLDLVWLEGRDVQVRLHGDAARALPRLGGSIEFDADSLDVADLDNDGRLDLVTGNGWESRTVSVVLGRGDGTFGAPVSASVLMLNNGEPPPGMALGDFDGDGDQDIATLADRSGIAVLWNTTARGSVDRDQNNVPDECDVMFRRGDCDGDGVAGGQVTDALFLLGFLFLGETEPPCFAACDADGDGRVRGSVTDALYLLAANFLGGPTPPAPYPDCGTGSASDGRLGCVQVVGCP